MPGLCRQNLCMLHPMNHPALANWLRASFGATRNLFRMRMLRDVWRDARSDVPP